MIDRTERQPDKRAFDKNTDQLMTDGGEEKERTETNLEPVGAENKELDTVTGDKKDAGVEVRTSETEAEKEFDVESDNESIVDKVDSTVKGIFGDRLPTSRFGRQSPSPEATESYSQGMSAGGDIDLEDASRAVEQLDADVEGWNKDRSEYEREMQRMRSELQSDLSEDVKEISSEIARVESWANQPLSEENVYEADANRGSHSFEEYHDLGLAEFVSVLSEEAGHADSRYQHRQEQIAELGKELDQMRKEDEGIEDSEELASQRGLGTDSDEISQYERKAVDSRRKEVSDEIEMHKRKKDEHEKEFVAYTDEVEEVYRDHATEVGSYVAEAAEDLQETTRMLENLSDTEIPVLEDRLQEEMPEDASGKILDDGEQEVREQYRDAVNALGIKAAQQYSQIESALGELEEIEEGMADEYFSNMMRSGSMEDRVDSISNGQNYEEHLTGLVDESLGDEYAASDKIRNVFRGVEPEIG